MRWSTIGLVVLGIVAAACAAFLVAGLRAQPGDTAGKEGQSGTQKIKVLVAKEDIKTLTHLRKELITTKTMLESQAPKGYYTDPTHVRDRLLIRQVAKDHVFTEVDFATKDSGLTLAYSLEEGELAVTLLLPRHASVGGHLYPGSVVDVLASFKPPSGEGEAVSTVLLEKVKVLGVGNRTILSPGSAKSDEDGSRSRQREVTLRVDSDQAKILELAIRYGTMSLALRNPSDDTSTRPGLARLSGLSRILSQMRPASQQPSIAKTPEEAAAQGPATQAPQAGTAGKAAPSTAESRRQSLAPVPGLWDIEIIRGSDSETKTFPMPESEL
ncbi:MAG: Flp pilus assembly protein CpaB [Planctomycetota bacterium]|jgi:pilus assembly protein CpaB